MVKNFVGDGAMAGCVGVAREQLTRKHAFLTARERPLIKNSFLRNQQLQSSFLCFEHGKHRSVYSFAQFLIHLMPFSFQKLPLNVDNHRLVRTLVFD